GRVRTCPRRVYKSRWEDRLQGGRRAKGWKARPADGMAEVENTDGMSRENRRSYYEIRDLFLDFVDHGGKQD
uniref:hypothetical protein n=1 Tax=Eisenbergiella tayi TaxID=1432052 RepID=UPI00055777A1